MNLGKSSAEAVAACASSLAIGRQSLLMVSVIATAVVGGACSTRYVSIDPVPPATHDIRRHAIFVDGGGKPIEPTLIQSGPNADERSGIPGVSVGVMPRWEFDTQIASIMQGARQHPSRRILLFIHGGMTSVKGARDMTASLVDAMMRDGYYPIFVNWNSAPLIAYRNHLVGVRQGLNAKWALPTSPIWFASDLGRGAMRAPITWTYQAGGIVRGPFWDRAGWAKRSANYLQAQEGPNPDPLVMSLGTEHVAVGPRIGRVATGLLFAPTKLVSSPIIDGAGTPAWQNMLRRTQMLFRRQSEYDTIPDSGHREHAASGAVSVLLDSLRQLAIAEPRLRVTLIGHSMGTIVANRMLSGGGLPVDTIVYMASAASLGDMQQSVLPYLGRNRDARFFNLMLHPRAEISEINKFDIVPRGSLLEWIDDFLANPETHLDRRLGKYSNFIAAEHVVPDSVRRQVSAKGFAYGLRVDNCGVRQPQKHGEFNEPEMQFWRTAFWMPCRLSQSTTKTQ